MKDQNGPNAALVQAENPACVHTNGVVTPAALPPKKKKAHIVRAKSHTASGNATLSSAVMIASGTLHTKGMTRKPIRARNGPPARTATWNSDASEQRKVR